MIPTTDRLQRRLNRIFITELMLAPPTKLIDLYLVRCRMFMGVSHTSLSLIICSTLK